MSSILTCPHPRYKTPSAVKNMAVDMSGHLDDGEILTGTPTVSVSPSGPTLGSCTINSGPQMVNGQKCPAGTVVKFTASGGTAGVDYAILVSSSTSGSQTVQGYITLKVASS
jgi:hypothetical protein